MRAKTLILLFVALGCGMIAAVAVSKAVMDKNPGETAEPMTEIFVAAKKLSVTAKITPDMVRLEKWPNKRLPEEAMTDLEQFDGWYPRMEIFPGEPIILSKITEDNSNITSSIPPGYRLFDIPCSKSYMKPGDHVDVVGTFSGGRGRNSGPPQTQTVMRKVKIHAINGSAIRDSDDEAKPKPSKNLVFQLLVKQTQIEALSLANTMGTLDLIICPVSEDDGNFEDTGDAFLSWIEAQTDEEEEEEGPELYTADRSFQAPIVPAQDAKDEKQHEMQIITPNGVKTYVWTSNDELPKEKVDEPKEEEYRGQGAGYAYGPSGINYSNYGGYQPTYPTSVTPPSTSESPNPEEAPSPVN